jgi:hypothetical protein
MVDKARQLAQTRCSNRHSFPGGVVRFKQRLHPPHALASNAQERSGRPPHSEGEGKGSLEGLAGTLGPQVMSVERLCPLFF